MCGVDQRDGSQWRFQYGADLRAHCIKFLLRGLIQDSSNVISSVYAPLLVEESSRCLDQLMTAKVLLNEIKDA